MTAVVSSFDTLCCRTSLHAVSNAYAATTTPWISLQRWYCLSAVAGKTADTGKSKGVRGGLLRASTLLLNDPPPDYEVCVHRGLKVQASILLQRIPLTLTEPRHEQQFRQYKEAWEEKTNNNIILRDEITYMQLPDHFLETQEQQQQGEQQQRKTGDSQLSELDMLLQQQGLALTRRKTRKRQQEDARLGLSLGSAAAAAAGEMREQSLTRLPKRVLMLLVKYGDIWQLPVEDRRAGQTMRQTLARLCMQQLGLRAAPFIVGFAPAAVRHIRSRPGATIQGREVFYYRAYHVPGQPDLSPSPGSPVRDWAWVSAEEARARMPCGAFAAIRDALVLG